MQLTMYSLVFLLFFLCQELKSQVRKSVAETPGQSLKSDAIELSHETYEKPDWKTIDVDFLSSYYSQDGNNAAVTGGIGTERLTDFTQKIIVSIPTSKQLSLSVDGGYDYYSSASTDNIDPIRSDDSAADMRIHGNLGLTLSPSANHAVGLRFGGSTEYDYTSLNGGIHYNWLSNNENTSLGLALQAFIDDWKIIYPIELRGEGRLVSTDKRQSYNAALSFSQVLTKKTQISFQLEGIYMNGLLSTPFHRVYFREQDRARVEQLPSTRLKLPLGLRLHHYLSEKLIARIYYRYYWDDWGIQGHTAQLELPIKINRFFSIAPSYRYHTQSAAEYFLPYKEHSVTDNFYTSDFDLAALNSHGFGIGISFAPAGGVVGGSIPLIKGSHIQISKIELRLGHYRRSTGLTANIASIGVGIQIK